MPVVCPNCGGSHPKWECKAGASLVIQGPRNRFIETPEQKAALQELVQYEGIPEGVVIPKNGIPRWVNEWPQGNFEAKIAKGYLVILNKDGSHVTRKSGNENLLQYLMVAPERLSGPPPPPDKNDKKISLPSNVIEGTATEVVAALPPTVKDYMAAVKDLPPPKKAAARLGGGKRIPGLAKAIASIPAGEPLVVEPAPGTAGSKAGYNAYMKEYMKKYRAKKKAEKP